MKPELHALGIARDETSNLDFTLQFKISPPAAVRPGAKFTLPAIITTRPAPGRHPLDYDLAQQLLLYASLRDEYGRDAATTGALTGELSDGVHSRDDDAIMGYSKFDSLAIHKSGRFRIRVCLAVAGAGGQPGLVKKAYIDSHVIRVDPSAEAVQKPSKLVHLKYFAAARKGERYIDMRNRCGTTLDPSRFDGAESEDFRRRYCTVERTMIYWSLSGRLSRSFHDFIYA